MEGWLTTADVAEMHGVSRGRVVQWIHEGILKAEKVQQIWLIRKEIAKNFVRRPITGRPRKS